MKSLIYSCAVLAVLLCSCDKTNPGPGNNNLQVPATYTFPNMDYSGQTYRQDMLEEIIGYMESANIPGNSVSAATLKNMYSNSGSPFLSAVLNNCGKQLKDKTYPLHVNLLEAYMDSLSTASMSATAGSNGVAGVVTSTTDPNRKFLLGANGVHYAEVIEKIMMGSVFLYQATDYYLGNSGIGNNVDNTVITPGEGTDMEHHWDEAFGYFGATPLFPAVSSGSRFWAEYAEEVDGLLHVSDEIMYAFKTGRSAISAHNYVARDYQAEQVKRYWDHIVAGMVIHELNEVLEDYSDDALRNHEMSEALGFAFSLQYNPMRKISNADHQLLLSYIGNNFYTISIANINNAKNLLSTIYGFDDIKNQL